MQNQIGVPHRVLGRYRLTVSAVGLGCMRMSEFDSGRNDAESVATLHRALDLGVRFLDTADLCGGRLAPGVLWHSSRTLF